MPPDPALIARLQAGLRAAAGYHLTPVDAAPFTVFVNPFDILPYLNYAIPNAPVADFVRGLALARHVFAERRRRPRFEFIEEYASDLPAILRTHGLHADERLPMLICTPAMLLGSPLPPGSHLVALDAQADDALVRQHLETNERGFGAGNSGHFADDDLYRLRKMLAEGAGVTAYHEHAGPVATGMVNPPHEGVAEIVGITTLQAWRGRGFASAVTVRLAQEAFARGISLLFLTAADERASRVYERVGFQRVATLAMYTE